MAKKFILKIAPGINFSVNPEIKLRTKKLEILLDLANSLSKIFWTIFFILLLSTTLYPSEANIGTYYFVAIIIVGQVGFFIIRRLLSKNELLPSVANDLFFLIFTSLVALSLFINTILYKDIVNIWGGKDFRAISGVSIIAYWFIYYLISINFSSKESLKSIFRFVGLGYLISFILGLTALKTLPIDFMNVFALSNPGLLILALTQKKQYIINILNFLISTLVLFSMPSGIVQIIVFSSYFILFIVLLINQRSRLGIAFEELNIRKLSFFEYVKRNFLTILFIVSIIFSLLGVLWLSKNFNTFFFDKFIIGINTIRFPNINNLLLGNGLMLNEGSIFFQFLSTYGIIPALGFIFLIFILIRDSRKYLKTANIPLLGFNLFCYTIFFSIFFYLLFENVGIDILMIIIVLIFTLLSIQKQVYLVQKELVFSNVLADFDHIKKDNVKFFLNFLRILAIIFVFFSCIYLLSNINYINIFISS